MQTVLRLACLALLPLLAPRLPVAAAPTPLPGPPGDYAAPTSWPAHPRLIAPPAAWQQLAANRARDPELEGYVQGLLRQARGTLDQQPVARVLIGRRLLDKSRTFIQRTLLWAFAYRVTGERAFLDRAVEEMTAVAAFSDWHPEHFLDVAEMTAGMALGYDWLYADLSDTQRRTFRTALVEKGLNLVRKGHPTFSMKMNWGQVCIGGLSLGALALADEEPELANDVLRQARSHAFIALEAYVPDGVYPEGPSYWVYGTTYETLLISALRSALGTDWGLMAAPGLQASAEFFAQVVGPTGLFFNYSDSGERPELAPPLFYFAREKHQPALLRSQASLIALANRSPRPIERFAPLVALWWPTPDPRAAPAPLPRTFIGHGRQPVAVWRQSWTDPGALFFAIKGGGGGLNHAHLDGGSFVFDLDGVRWARDLGMQDYESLESKKVDLWNMAQKSDRWKVFRLGSSAHNTLTIDGALHQASGLATLARADDHGAEFDLTPIFLPDSAAQVTRAVQVQPRSVELQDSARGARPGASIRWAMDTGAAIAIEGHRAVLTEKGRKLVVEFAGDAVELASVDLSQPVHPFDAPNPGARQLIATSPVQPDGTWHLTTRLSGAP